MDAIPNTHIEMIDGNAIIAGTHLKAKIIASVIVKAGSTIDEVMELYDLTRGQVHAALAYYYDHEEAIEQSMQDTEDYVRRVGLSADSHLETLRRRLKNRGKDAD